MPASFTPELKRLPREAGCNFGVDGEIPSRHLANAVLKQAGLPKAF